MSARKDRYGKYGVDNETGCDCSKCSRCVIKLTKESSSYETCKKLDSMKIPVKQPESGYVTQILCTGVRADNVYEAKMLLAPEVDMSTIKITVKGDNLRVNVHRPLGDLAKQLPGILERSALGDLVKRTIKHCENFLIPEAIDADKIRAVIDNKQRMLILTAPSMKPDKAKRRGSATKT